MREQYLYIFKCFQGPCKIGISHMPRQRLGTIKNASPWGAEDVGMYKIPYDKRFNIEAAAHKAVADKRTSGEWFDVKPETAIKAVEETLKSFGVEPKMLPVVPGKFDFHANIKRIEAMYEAEQADNKE